MLKVSGPNSKTSANAKQKTSKIRIIRIHRIHRVHMYPSKNLLGGLPHSILTFVPNPFSGMHPNDVLTYAESFRAKLEKKGGGPPPPPAHTHIHLYVYTAVDRTLTGPAHTELQLSLPSNTAQRCAQRAARCALRAARCALRAARCALFCCSLRCAQLTRAAPAARCAARSSLYCSLRCAQLACCSLRCAQLALLLAALRAARCALRFW